MVRGQTLISFTRPSTHVTITVWRLLQVLYDQVSFGWEECAQTHVQRVSVHIL